MPMNVSFNDDISLGAIQDIAVEINSLNQALANMQTEITTLLGKLNELVYSLGNELVTALSTSASEGNLLQTVCNGFVGALGFGSLSQTKKQEVVLMAA